MTLSRSVGLKRSGFAKSERKEASAVKKIRAKKCAVKTCRAPFEPDRPFITWCSPECGAVVALALVAKDEAKKAKAERIAARAEQAADKASLEKFKPLSYWEGITERHCNAYIRARDPDQCISCGVTNSSAWQAGHYKSVGSNSTLRYHEDNIHKQCIQCNMFKGSNAIQYRIALLEKIGLERVEWLEGWHPTVKMTAAAAQEIAEYYKQKLKQLKGK